MEKSGHTFSTVKIDPKNPIADTHVSGRTEVTTEETNSTESIVDIFFPEKEYGHITLQNNNFQFIGPNRDSVVLDTIEKFIPVATAILQTGVPNYKAARIPIATPLNLDAFDKYLEGYPDKRLGQYLRFGFPLCINPTGTKILKNHEVSNHFSARQFPLAVEKYLGTEIEHGAILGPVNTVPHHAFHCSPLLTRPKDGADRQVILDLSYPKGRSVNDFGKGSV